MPPPSSSLFPVYQCVSSRGNYEPETWWTRGRTPEAGICWEMRTANRRDLEDDDTTYSLEIGDISIVYDDENNRTYGSHRVAVRNMATKKDLYTQVCGTMSDGTTGSLEEAREAMRPYAEKEGLALEEFLGMLPHPLTRIFQ